MLHISLQMSYRQATCGVGGGRRGEGGVGNQNLPHSNPDRGADSWLGTRIAAPPRPIYADAPQVC